MVSKELLDKLNNGWLQIGHWREKAAAQVQVRAEIIKHLWTYLPGQGYGEDEISMKIDAVFTHFFTVSGGTRQGAVAYH